MSSELIKSRPVWCFVPRQWCITGIPKCSALVPLPAQHLLITGLWKQKIIDRRRSFPVFQMHCLVHIWLSPDLSSYESPLPPPAPASLPQAASHETAAMFLLLVFCMGCFPSAIQDALSPDTESCPGKFWPCPWLPIRHIQLKLYQMIVVTLVLLETRNGNTRSHEIIWVEQCAP